MGDKLTYREEVLNALKPIADVFHIDFDYIDEGRRQYIVCNDRKICVSDTSICGIREELIGYIFLTEWRRRSLGAFDKQVRNHIRQYWFDDDFKQPWIKRN